MSHTLYYPRPMEDLDLGAPSHRPPTKSLLPTKSLPRRRRDRSPDLGRAKSHCLRQTKWWQEVDLPSKAYVYYHKNERILETRNLKVSTFLPPGLERHLQWLPSHHYLLGVGYASKGDVQLGVTATCLDEESVDTCAAREIEEELGSRLVMPLRTVDTVKMPNPRFRNFRHFTYFEGGAKNLSVVGFPYVPEEPRLDKTRKAVILIHDELSTLLDLMARIASAPGIAADGIDRVAAISVGDARFLASHLVSSI